MPRKKGFVDNAVSVRWKNLYDRIRAFQHYGGFKCNCCGTEEFSFLSLDHIGGEGNPDRLARFGNKFIGGHHMYRRLRREGFPPGYQVLCMNCQVGRRDNGGYCPHKKSSLNIDELVLEFEKLRVGHGNHAATGTVEYRSALSKVMRKSKAAPPVSASLINDPAS